LRRNDFGAGLTNGESDDGGFDELRLFNVSCRFSGHHTMIDTRPAEINQARRPRPD